MIWTERGEQSAGHSASPVDLLLNVTSHARHVPIDENAFRASGRRLGTWLSSEGRLASPQCLDGSADDVLAAALDPGGNVSAIAHIRTALDLGRSVRITCCLVQIQARRMSISHMCARHPAQSARGVL